jgi:hypothetical protein
MASISSINIIAFQAVLAFWNKFLTFAAHIQTSISINSDHDTEKNGTEASPAIALAKSVLPDQG